MSRIPLWSLFLLNVCLLVPSSQGEWDVTSNGGIYRYDDSGNFLGLLSITSYSGIANGSAGLFAAYPANFSSASAVDRYVNGAFSNRFGTDGDLFSPEDLTLGPNGTLYVAAISHSNLSNGKVARFNPSTGAYLGDFVAAGAGGLQRPNGVVFGPDGNLYVADTNLGTVLRYNGSTGAFLGTFTSGLTLTFASGMEFGPDNNLYVADTNGGRVAEFNGTSGAFIKSITTTSVTPADVAFDTSGLLYVTDIGPGSRIMRYNAQTGASLGRFDSTNVGTSSPLTSPDYIVHAAPEPSTFSILACSAAFLSVFRRRRRRMGV